MLKAFGAVVASFLVFAVVCFLLADVRPEFALYWSKLGRLGLGGVLLALFAGSLAYIYEDAMADRRREAERQQHRRWDLFNKTVWAVWENPTRPGGWYGVLDRSNWRK